jgi:uncharacterized protein YggU (UPF0235/DUF167 family)
MKIFVDAKPWARVEKVEKIAPPENRPTEQHFMVAVKEPPLEGKANQAIARALANYFNLPRSRVCLVSGFSSKKKVFEI